MLGAILDHVALVHRLVALGWAPDGAGVLGPENLRDRLTTYQLHHGLPTCGRLDGATERHLCTPRCCAHPDVMGVADELQKWPTGMTISWAFETVAGPLPRTALETAFISATQAWMFVCGVKFEPHTNTKTAKLLVRFDGIDGGGRVLAHSELPDGTGATRLQRFDAEENWVVSDKPAPGEVDFIRVATHELGHTLGIGHIAAGNLLQPLYDLRVRAPRAGDITEAVARYGPPTAANPKPAAPPSASGDDLKPPRLVIEIDGKVERVSVGGYTLTKNS